MRSFLLFLVLTCALPVVAPAQRVYWDPPGGRLGMGKTEQISLVFEDCTPDDRFELPSIEGLEFETPSRSQQTSVINFQMSSRVVLTYPVNATRRGDVVIPAFDAATNKGRLAVGEVHFVVGDASVGTSGVAVNDIVSSQLRPARAIIWAGEVVDIEYIFIGSTRYSVSLAGNPEWKPSGAVLEPFSEMENISVTVGNERRPGARYRTRALFTEPRSSPLDPVRQVVNVQTGERPGFLFSQPRIEQFNVSSDTPTLTVKALPNPAPAGFTGAVGDFKLESTVVPQTARIGEPVTWTLKLSGTGNWTTGLSLPEREVSADFQVVQPKSRTEMQEGKLFQGAMTEDAVLVPTRAGTYRLGPVSFTVFDPTTGQYRTETTPQVTVTIDPVPAAFTPAAPQTSPATADPQSGKPSGGLPGSSAAAPAPPLPDDLAPPPHLPGEPLPLGLEGAAPRVLALWTLSLAAFIPAIILWIGFAVRRALRTDPVRHRRRALKELRRLVAGLQGAAGQPDTVTLERWRTLTAALWDLRRATPTADDLSAALSQGRGVARPELWLDLWRDAEHAMFSATGTLPTDWTTRAAEAIRTARVRARAGWWPVRIHHWLPRAAVAIGLAVGLLSDSVNATEARDAYREGRFAEARDAWLTRLASHPGDWAAHNNVALAQAQLDAWAPATAHWTTAFLLHPRDESLRRNLRLAVSNLGGLDPAMRRVLDSPWYDEPIGWLAPAEWQGLLTGGFVALALGLIALVTSLYLQGGRFAVRATGQAMAFVGLLAVAGSSYSLYRYGPLADPQAAMVVQPAELRSIPSEVADKQKSAPVAPGTVVIIERSFLGWNRVRASGDSAGWLRKEAILPFYRSSAGGKAEGLKAES